MKKILDPCYYCDHPSYYVNPGDETHCYCSCHEGASKGKSTLQPHDPKKDPQTILGVRKLVQEDLKELIAGQSLAAMVNVYVQAVITRTEFLSYEKVRKIVEENSHEASQCYDYQKIAEEVIKLINKS